MAVLTLLARLGDATLAAAGALGFFTRLPVGTGEPAWRALTTRPAAMVLVAYPIGAAVALPFALPLPSATAAVALPLALLALTGVTHLDGLADLGDAVVVHGDVERRRSVLLDTDVGVGAVTAVGAVLVGVALAGHGLATAPLAFAVLVIVAAEVGAKLGMALLAGLAPATFGTLGSQFGGATHRTALAAALLAGPVPLATALLAGPTAPIAVAATLAVVAGPVAALAVGSWATTRLDGVNGDCFGATNELARLLGLHAGLVAIATDGSLAPALALEVVA